MALRYFLFMRFMALLFTLLAGSALAQDRIPSHCIALADSTPGLTYLHQASFQDPVLADTVRIQYVNHAMFLIQAQGGTSAMTDFAGYFGNVDFLPDVVTMNNAHSTHWTAFPDPDLPHVLEGWADEGVARDHYLDLGDMLVRNVHTDTRRSGFGDGFDVRENGNSIFVFEVAGLCIGHLGHLHHEPDPVQYAALGRMDVVMAAVDGGLTLDHETLLRVLGQLRSSVVIPMHWFGRATLDAFLIDMEDSGYQIDRTGVADVTLSVGDLPSMPTVIVLEPRYLETPQN